MDDFAKEEKEKLIKGWLDASAEDLKIGEELISNKHFHHGLYFCHLAVEKILKGAFLIKKDTYPPAVHDLQILVDKIGLDLATEEMEDLKEITTFNVEARYDILKQGLYRKATPKFTSLYLEKTKILLDKFKKYYE